MMRLLAVMMFCAGLAGAEPAETAVPGPSAPAAPSAIGVLSELLSYSSAVDGSFAADFDGVIACARAGGAVGLRVTPQAGERRGSVTLLCERTVAHDTSVDEVVIGPGLLDGYERAFGRGARVDGAVFGFGTGRPAAGGVPSFNFTPITPEHARPAVWDVVIKRETRREC